jgi:hypothetical protein
MQASVILQRLHTLCVSTSEVIPRVIWPIPFVSLQNFPQRVQPLQLLVNPRCGMDFLDGLSG